MCHYVQLSLETYLIARRKACVLRHKPNMTKLPQQELPVAGKNKQKLKFRINNNKARDHVIFKTRIQHCILLFFPADGKESGIGAELGDD
jgi:hypothetical protein